MSEPPASDAILQHRALEVQQRSQPQATEPKVGVQLGLVDWVDVVDGFDLDDQAVLDHEVHLIAVIKFDALVSQRELLLPNIRHTGLIEFKAQAFLVSPEFAVHRHTVKTAAISVA